MLNIEETTKKFSKQLDYRNIESVKSIFSYCKTCDHNEDDCEKCYPELGYKNTKAERDTKAIHEFVESESFQDLMRNLKWVQ